ncbi:hypothetical protein [Corynebacterium timonense]|uniref:Neocarzinostatin family protein n=1 Tax=Corynebacterium timonense TaxID=441500 RepID=A0A1H1UKU3_9CORY|nr:hypothetical protein [Corynebacterium timonense]SDS72921.1 hypothetical protein SAMN04488539_2262 [Corynebacterium timonense]
MYTPARTIVLPTAVAAAALTLSACSATTEPPQPQTVTQTTTVEPTVETHTPSTHSTSAAPAASVRSVDVTQLQQVSPTLFDADGSKMFSFVNGGAASQCVFYGAVTCFGTPDKSVPDVDGGRPGAVQISADGVAYTNAEGIPPATAELKPGQWVNLGNVQCAKPDNESLVCTSDSAAFEIAGADHRIVTEGPVLSSRELTEKALAQPGMGYETGTDVLVQGPIMCGAMEGHRLADVVTGEITCAEAMDVLDRYDARKFEEGMGNTISVSFDGWDCSSPTAARSEELGAATVCYNKQRGIEIRDPLMGVSAQ